MLRGARGDDGGVSRLPWVSPALSSPHPPPAPPSPHPPPAAPSTRGRRLRRRGSARPPLRMRRPAPRRRAEAPLPCRPRQIRHKAPRGGPDFRCCIFFFFLIPIFPSLRFPSGTRSAPGALSRRAPAAMEAAGAGERGRAGGRGRAQGSPRGGGEGVPVGMPSRSFRTTSSPHGGGRPGAHRPALPHALGAGGPGGLGQPQPGSPAVPRLSVLRLPLSSGSGTAGNEQLELLPGPN